METAQLILVKECLRKQLEEYELLKSIYYKHGEFQTDNMLLVSDIQDFLDGTRNSIHEKLDFRIKIQLTDNIKMELSVMLGQLYPPYEIPIMTFRTDSLSKKEESIVQRAVELFIEKEVDKTEPYIFQIISWLQDNIDELLEASRQGQNENAPEKLELAKMERLWIWSHHIYSKIKRQDIVKLGKDYDLTGFLLPGKPGVICFEGPMDSTQAVIKIVKSWQWQKLKIVKVESGCDEANFNRFKEFREILFVEGDGGDEIKMNMSQFFKYLEAHRSLYMRKELFGFD